MAFYNLSPEELQLVLGFVNDENNDILSTEIPQRFVGIAAAFSSRLIKSYKAEKSRALRLERVGNRLRGKMDKEVAEGKFAELKINIMQAALCVVYLLKENDYIYSRNKVQYLLYEAYSSWLADKKERIFDEHPVAQEWGPHFWAISKKIGFRAPVATIEDFKAVAEADSGVAAFLRNVVKKYGSWTEDALKTMHTESVPYKNAKPKKNALTADDAKWGKPIKDADICVWTRSKPQAASGTP